LLKLHEIERIYLHIKLYPVISFLF